VCVYTTSINKNVELCLPICESIVTCSCQVVKVLPHTWIQTARKWIWSGFCLFWRPFLDDRFGI